jgi:hypothetical protein
MLNHKVEYQGSTRDLSNNIASKDGFCRIVMGQKILVMLVKEPNRPLPFAEQATGSKPMSFPAGIPDGCQR